MSKPWYEDEEFLKLRKKWYKKLEKDKKYNDIEIIDWDNGGRSGNLLLGLGHMDCVRMGRGRLEAARRYYELAEHWATHLDSLKGAYSEFRKPATERTPDTKDLRKLPRWRAKEVRKIWRLHAKGYSYRDIAIKCKTYKQKVGEIIRRQQELMLRNTSERLEYIPSDDE